MFLRLLLLQFRYGEEQAHVAEEQIEEQIARFSRELNGAVVGIQEFHKRSDEALTGWIASLTKLCTAVNANVEEIGKETATLKDALVEVHKASVAHNGKIVQAAVDEFNRKVEPNLTRISEANAQLAARVAAGTSEVGRTVDAGIGGLRRITRNQEALVDIASAFTQGSAEQMHKAEVALATVAERIRGIHVPQDAVERIVTRQAEGVTSRLPEATAKLERAIKDLTATVEASTKHMRIQRNRGWLAFWK